MVKKNKTRALLIVMYASAFVCVAASIQLAFFSPEGHSRGGIILNIVATFLTSMGTWLSLREENKAINHSNYENKTK